MLHWGNLLHSIPEGLCAKTSKWASDGGLWSLCGSAGFTAELPHQYRVTLRHCPGIPSQTAPLWRSRLFRRTQPCVESTQSTGRKRDRRLRDYELPEDSEGQNERSFHLTVSIGKWHMTTQCGISSRNMKERYSNGDLLFIKRLFLVKVSLLSVLALQRTYERLKIFNILSMTLLWNQHYMSKSDMSLCGVSLGTYFKQNVAKNIQKKRR